MIKSLNLTPDENALLTDMCAEYISSFPKLARSCSARNYQKEDGEEIAIYAFNIGSQNAFDELKKNLGADSVVLDRAIYKPFRGQTSKHSPQSFADTEYCHESFGKMLLNKSTGHAELFDHPVPESNFYSINIHYAYTDVSSRVDVDEESHRKYVYRAGERVCEFRLSPDQYIRMLRADTEVPITLVEGYGLGYIEPPPRQYKPQVKTQNNFSSEAKEICSPLSQAVDQFVEFINNSTFSSKKKIAELEFELNKVYQAYDDFNEALVKAQVNSNAELNEQFKAELMKVISNEVARLPIEAQGNFDMKTLILK